MILSRAYFTAQNLFAVIDIFHYLVGGSVSLLSLDFTFNSCKFSWRPCWYSWRQRRLNLCRSWGCGGRSDAIHQKHWPAFDFPWLKACASKKQKLYFALQTQAGTNSRNKLRKEKRKRFKLFFCLSCIGNSSGEFDWRSLCLQAHEFKVLSFFFAPLGFS